MLSGTRKRCADDRQYGCMGPSATPVWQQGMHTIYTSRLVFMLHICYNQTYRPGFCKDDKECLNESVRHLRGQTVGKTVDTSFPDCLQWGRGSSNGAFRIGDQFALDACTA